MVADSLAAVDANTQQLIEESDPRTTIQLFPDWERNYGLPDPCSGTASGMVAQRQQLVAQVVERQGGQSKAFLTALAASYGYAVTLSTVHVVTCEDDCSDAVYEDLWAFVLLVNAPLNSVIVANCRDSTCIDPLSSWGNSVLECRLRRVLHAHTTPIFAYT